MCSRCRRVQQLRVQRRRAKGEAMEMEMKDELQAQIERLAGAAETLERLVSQQSLLAADGEASIGRIVAMVGATAESKREAELLERLTAAERTIAELRASAPAT